MYEENNRCHGNRTAKGVSEDKVRRHTFRERKKRGEGAGDDGGGRGGGGGAGRGSQRQPETNRDSESKFPEIVFTLGHSDGFSRVSLTLF